MRLVPFVHQDLNFAGSLSESPPCRRFGKDGALVAASILRITQNSFVFYYGRNNINATIIQTRSVDRTV